MSLDSVDAALWDVPSGLVMLDAPGVILGHNREFVSLLGQDAGAVLAGRTCRDLWRADSLPDFDRFWEEINASPGRPAQCNVCAERGGSVVDLCLKGRLLSEPTGGGHVLLAAETLLQFDIDSVNGVFALGFEQQTDAAMVFSSGPTLAESRVLAANLRAGKNAGRSPEELLGQPVSGLAPSALSDEVWRAAEAAFAAGERFETTLVEPRGGGRYGIVEWQFWPLHESDGRVTHWADQRRPVTEEKKRADKLQEHNRFLTEALLASDIGIWQWNLVTNEINFSQRLLTSLGYRPEDIDDPHAFNLSLRHPDDVPMMEESIRQAVEAGTAFEYVSRLKAADGGYRWFRVRGQAFHDANGRPTRLVGTESEASEEVLLRDKLLRAEEIAKIGYWSSRFDSPNLEWSPGVYRIHGFDPDTYTPRRDDIRNLVHPDDWSVMAEAFGRAQADGELNRGDQHVFRCRVVRVDGSVRHCEFTAVTDYDATGKPVGATGAIQDVTELVEMEERLLRSQKLEVVGKLAGGVAHDFNNLLAVIMGNLELLNKAGAPAEWTRHIDAALEATRRGGELTRNLLSFARKAVLQPAVLDVNHVVAETIKLMQRVLPATVQIDTRLASDLQSVHADRASFENALLNLAINARDAMPSGGALTIGTENLVLEQALTDAFREDLPPGRYVVVSVEDTGVGIPADIQAEVFTPFYTTKPDRQGSGLGLSMVLGFVKQSGGGVRVQSAPGEGAVFRLYFPATNLSADAAHVDRDPAPDPIPLSGKVLLVEDDAQVNRLLARQVEATGLTCVTALDSKQAMERFADSGPFDLLLSDVVIPGPHKGPSLASRLRDLQPGLKVILLSGYPDESATEVDRLSPDDVRLMKPVSKRDLQATLQAVLGGSDPARA